MRIPTSEEAEIFHNILENPFSEKSGLVYSNHLKDIKPECYNKAFFSTDKLYCNNPVIRDNTVFWTATPFDKSGQLQTEKSFEINTDEFEEQFRKDAGLALWNQMNYNSEPADL